MPVAASPYSPSSRRFVNPLYLRVSDTAAYRAADPATRAVVDALRPDRGDLIDYDAVWPAKRPRWSCCGRYARPVDLAADPALATFATFCALGRAARQRTGGPGPPSCATRTPRRSPSSAASSPTGWPSTPGCSTCATSSSTRSTTAARAAGMPVGVVHDLAVGIDPGGADGWLLADVLAQGVRVGAPPDDVQPARPGLGARGVAAGPARRDRVRRVPRHAAADLAARRRPARRPRRRAVAAVVGAAGRWARPRAPTCATTPRRCSASWRWRRTGPARWWSVRISARSNRR